MSWLHPWKGELKLRSTMQRKWPKTEITGKRSYALPVLRMADDIVCVRVLIVRFQPADNWIDELEDVTCQEKESKVELACKFSNPKARVSWYKNKLEVFQGLKYKLVNEDGVFRLFINNASMEDAGKYTCQANTQETSCYLTVEG